MEIIARHARLLEAEKILIAFRKKIDAESEKGHRWKDYRIHGDAKIGYKLTQQGSPI